MIGKAVGLAWDAAPGWTLGGAGLAVGQTGLTLAALYLTKLMVDRAGAFVAHASLAPSAGQVMAIVGGLAACGLLSALCYWLAWLVNVAHTRIVTDHVQVLIQRKSVEMDLWYYENSEYHDSFHRAQQEASYRPTAIISGLGQAAQGGLTLAVLAVFVAATHWGLTCLLLAAAVPGVLLRLRYAKRLYAWRRESTLPERLASYFHSLLTAGQSAKEIRMFDLGGLFMDRFRQASAELRDQRLQMAVRHTLVSVIATAVTSLSMFGAYALIVYRTLQGTISLGEMVMFYQVFQRGQTALADFLGSLAGLYENSLFLSNLYDFLDLDPKLSDRSRTQVPPLAVRQGVVFERVGFRYPGSGRKSLDDISLVLRPGERVALVGASGSGKTTLAKLLCGLYQPSEGRITIDGIDVQGMDPAAMRRMMSVVFQDYVQFHLTARENIWLGDWGLLPDDPRVVAAACAANADATVAKLPKGYETVLGKCFDTGEELSVGEWQRIALARAFFRDAPIVVLDEPTSALDPVAEHDILHRIRQLMKNRVSLLISHRLAAVRDVDWICVLDGGRIVELGTHDELVARGGTYAKMFALQAEGYRGAPASPS